MAESKFPVIPPERGDDLHNLEAAETADLVMFMAMADIVAAFREAHTEIENIFYETLPPGMALKQRVTDMYSFDSYSGILFSPYPMFLQASLRSRTVGFPESGSGRGFYSNSLSKESEA